MRPATHRVVVPPSASAFRSASMRVLALVLLGGTFAAAEDRLTEQPRYTPTQRMQPAHLKATHDDVKRIRELRRSLPPPSGLHDYRAILHAHAEDAAHTGGTRAEMLADARRVGVHAILLSDHFRPPRDFITESWRGLRDGVLFIPGSEARGFLVYPTRSILDRMEAPTPEFIAAVKRDGGLIFLSHIEERPDHPTDDLDGLEIFNRHAAAKQDAAGILAIMAKLTDPKGIAELKSSLEQFPDEVLAAQVDYPVEYMAKWDAATRTRRLTGVAANDCHHNQVLIVKMVDAETIRIGTNVDRDDQMKTISAKLRPGIRELTRDHKTGDILARLDFDPYFRSFQNVSTHIFAPELTEAAIRDALREGHAYVSHDWMCDPIGFRFELVPPGRTDGADRAGVMMGSATKFVPGSKLIAEFPVPCSIRLIAGGRVLTTSQGDRLEFDAPGPGVYRVEARLILDGEPRPWIYANPIHVR